MLAALSEREACCQLLTDRAAGFTMTRIMYRLEAGEDLSGKQEARTVEYQVQMIYEPEDIAALVKALDYRRQPDKNLRRATKIGYPLFGVLLILSGVGVLMAMVTAGLFSLVTFLITVLTLLGGVALLRRSDTRAMAKRSWKRYPNKGLTMTYTFYKDHFEETDEVSGENTFQYLSITSVNEDENHYFLFTATNAAHMLRKDAFIQGDPASFGEFIHLQAAVLVDPVE